MPLMVYGSLGRLRHYHAGTQRELKVQVKLSVLHSELGSNKTCLLFPPPTPLEDKGSYRGKKPRDMPQPFMCSRCWQKRYKSKVNPDESRSVGILRCADKIAGKTQTAADNRFPLNSLINEQKELKMEKVGFQDLKKAVEKAAHYT